MPNYSQISKNERESIFLLLEEWKSRSDIWLLLGRHRSTIGREIERNSVCIVWRWAKKEKTKDDYYYHPESAQNKAGKRKKLGKKESPFENERLKGYVIEALCNEEKSWSPDIISAMVKQEYPDDESMRVSHETIYKYIYSKEGEALNLKSFLLRAHKKRKKWPKGVQSVKKKQIGKIVDRKDIEQRPKEVENRTKFGDWEWDSIVWWLTKWSVINTEIERKSRFIMALKIPWKTALETKEAIVTMFSPLPPQARRTTTLDNGTENAYHKQITKVLWIDVYYAKPYHSRERGSNEHGNGMIRRYLPKWTNFDNLTQEELQQIVNLINNRPRKILGYKT